MFSVWNKAFEKQLETMETLAVASGALDEIAM